MPNARDWELAKLALEAQHKYELFLTGLAAGALSFSVQFSQATQTRADWFLITAWVGLVVSLLAGIWRLSWHAPILQMQRKLAGKERDSERLAEALGTDAPLVELGTLRPLRQDEREEMDRKLRSTVEKWKAQMAVEDWWFALRYMVQLWAFWVGVTAYAAFRATPILFSLLGMAGKPSTG